MVGQDRALPARNNPLHTSFLEFSSFFFFHVFWERKDAMSSVPARSRMVTGPTLKKTAQLDQPGPDTELTTSKLTKGG